MSGTGTHLSRLLRVLVLGAVLAVAAAVVPDSAVKSTELNLVKVQRVDIDADKISPRHGRHGRSRHHQRIRSRRLRGPRRCRCIATRRPR